jgi:hypothetical protein
VITATSSCKDRIDEEAEQALDAFIHEMQATRKPVNNLFQVQWAELAISALM